MWHRLSYGFEVTDLAIRRLTIETQDDKTIANLKVAYTGDKKLIIEELLVKAKLTYLSSRESILAWVILAIGYFMDDVVGLQTVFGHMLPSSTWIIGGPVYRIKNKYVRKPLSILLGLVTSYFFVIYLIPIFWPLLRLGPYREFQQIADDQNLTLCKGTTKLTRPFILDPGVEDEIVLNYRSSSMIPSLVNGSPMLIAKISNVQESPIMKPYRLPGASEFVWRTEVSLYVKSNAGWNECRIDSGTGMVHLTL
jgi:hypothetical protein